MILTISNSNALYAGEKVMQIAIKHAVIVFLDIKPGRGARLLNSSTKFVSDNEIEILCVIKSH